MKPRLNKGAAVLGIMAVCFLVSLGVLLPLVSPWFFLYSAGVVVFLPTATKWMDYFFETLNL